MTPDRKRDAEMTNFTVFYRLECRHAGTQIGWPGDEVLCVTCGTMERVTDYYEVPPWARDEELPNA